MEEKKLTNEEIAEVVGALEKSKLKLSKNALVLIQYLQKELEEKEYFRQKWGKMFIRKNREAEKLKEEKEDLGKQLHERALKYCNLRAENERLTEENGQLQKQVDELKMEKARAMRGCEWLSDCQSQAIEDVVKKIYNELKTEVISVDIPRGGEPPEEGCEAVLWWKIEEHFKKKIWREGGKE